MARSTSDADNFVSLGLSRDKVRTVGNMKFDYNFTSDLIDDTAADLQTMIQINPPSNLKARNDLVQRRWDRNFTNNISIVVGDEWYAGNLSYHLKSRPTWFNTIEDNLSLITSDTGVVYTGNPKILKKFCPGIYGTIKPIGICMIGAK